MITKVFEGETTVIADGVRAGNTSDNLSCRICGSNMSFGVSFNDLTLCKTDAIELGRVISELEKGGSLEFEGYLFHSVKAEGVACNMCNEIHGEYHIAITDKSGFTTESSLICAHSCLPEWNEIDIQDAFNEVMTEEI
jgi:hypothetical protein